MRMLRNYKVTLSVNDVAISCTETTYPSAWDAFSGLGRAFSNNFSIQRLTGLSEGDKASAILATSDDGMTGKGNKVSAVLSVTVECLLNRPAPRAARRPPDVIAAEKKAKAEKARQRAIDKENRKKAEERERICRRQRITNQIDHAFRSGPEAGSEPAAKYITCQRCDAPAVFLELDREVPRGAAVLDESTIIGAGCSEHDYTRYSGNEKILCSRLEFFYTGIRRIGIKEANS